MEAVPQNLVPASSQASRRSQIIAAAGRAFGRKGYHATTVKDIAAEADLAPGTLYLYFAGKREILVGFFDEALGAAEAGMGDLADLPLADALETFLRERLGALQALGDLAKVIFGEALYDEDLRAKFAEHVLVRGRKLVVQLLEEHGLRGLPEAQVQAVVQALQAQVLCCGILWPALTLAAPGNCAQEAKEITRLTMGGINALLKEAEPGG